MYSPKLTAPAPKEDPSYLKSETLRMIKESESRTSGGNTQRSGASPQPYSGGKLVLISLIRHAN